MVSPVDSAAPSATAHLHALSPAGQNDSAGAKVFADMMKGGGAAFHGGGASQTSAPTPSIHSSGDTRVGLLQQLSGLNEQMAGAYDLADPFKSLDAPMASLRQVSRDLMVYQTTMHLTLTLTSGVTGFFKQMFNRHD